jgi:hypothetical protein
VPADSWGVCRQLAWNPAKSAHDPWWLSQSPALAIAQAQRYCAVLGLPSLSGNWLSTDFAEPPDT